MSTLEREQDNRYRVVDVFTQHPLEGNPLAVFPGSLALDAVTMQRIARELNLAETVFILRPTREDCIARLRIFTPLKEMRFAGHPTIGAAFVLLDEGVVGTKESFFVEEEVGPVAVRVESGAPPMLWLETPRIDVGRCYDPQLCADVLGLQLTDLLDVTPQLLTAGNPTVYVAVRDREAVDRAWLDLSGMRRLRGADAEYICVFVFTPTPEGAYSRMFSPEYGIPEDPATGSSTGPLASFMMRHGLVSNAAGTRFVSEQGTKMGRRSLLHVHVRGDSGVTGIEVGGHVAPLVVASMRLPA
ncbi:MAG: PhzF family phenazine biosynthesis protein [Sinobacteraceae bacterium]|nr:PhzF family phenazine biosynthesis protein [Nevskiaceae bacterium]